MGLHIPELPQELFFEDDDPDFDPSLEAADLISDKTGWCVFSFSWDEVKEIPANAGYTLIELLLLVAIIFVAVAAIAAIVGGGFIGWHFLSKVW